MADTSPGRAISVAKRVATMCDFIENPAIKKAVEGAVPVTMPREVGALGFDVPFWVGLGMVGLWAALDGFAERAALPRDDRCPTCGRRSCVSKVFAPKIEGNENAILGELEDLRHLYAHNLAGEADEVYFGHKRHVLVRDVSVELTCGAKFNGRGIQLGVSHLRMYSCTVQALLERFTS